MQRKSEPASGNYESLQRFSVAQFTFWLRHLAKIKANFWRKKSFALLFIILTPTHGFFAQCFLYFSTQHLFLLFKAHCIEPALAVRCTYISCNSLLIPSNFASNDTSKVFVITSSAHSNTYLLKCLYEKTCVCHLFFENFKASLKLNHFEYQILCTFMPLYFLWYIVFSQICSQFSFCVRK